MASWTVGGVLSGSILVGSVTDYHV
jgi:hypothetical protein